MTIDLDTLSRLAWLQIWQVTVVAILVGVVVRLCCAKRPRVAYALWMLVIVKSIVPPLWSSPTGLFSWALADTTAVRAVVADDLPSTSIDSPTIEPISEGNAKDTQVVDDPTIQNQAMVWPSIRVAALCLWFIGLVLGTGYVLAKARRRLARDPAIEPAYRRAIQLVSARAIATPRRAAEGPAGGDVEADRPGGLRPLPPVDPAACTNAVRHARRACQTHARQGELMHIRRGDIVASKLQLAAQLIWWFNPLVWWANQQATRERERCCDVEVIAHVGCQPVLYARTLLSLLEHKGRLRSLFALPGVRALEVTSLRLEFIMKHAQTDHRWTGAISRLLFAAGLFLLVPGAGITLQTRLQAGEEAGNSPSADAQLEQQMQGKWKIVQCEYSGTADLDIVGVEHTIDGTKWLRPNRQTGEYRLRFDASQNPKWVDLSADRLGDRTLKGICSLDGDKMTICYAYDPDLPRPTEFKTTPNSKAYLYVLERSEKGRHEFQP